MQQNNSKSTFSADELIRRLHKSNCIPALDENISQLCGMTHNSTTSATELTAIIMRDAALTSRLLTMANSAGYRPRNPVKTVSGAVILFGFERIQQLAVGLTLFHKHATDIRDKELYRLLVCAYCTGNLAMHLGKALNDKTPEEFFVAGLLQQIPRLVLANGFPDEYRKMEQRIAKEKLHPDDACQQTFGMRLADISDAIAKYWNVNPENLSAVNDKEQRRKVVSLSAETCDMLFGNRPTGPESMVALSGAIQQLLRRREFSLPDFIGESADTDPNMKQFFHLSAQDLTMMTRIAEWGRVSSSEVANSLTASFQKHPEAPPVDDSPLIMAHFLSELMLAVHGRLDFNNVLMIAQEGIFRCMQPEFVVACFIDRERKHLQGRLYAGRNSGVAAERFRVTLSNTTRLAAKVMSGRDALLTNAAKQPVLDDDHILEELHIDSMLLMPITANREPFGLLLVARKTGDPALTSDDSLWISAIASHIGLSFEQLYTN